MRVINFGDIEELKKEFGGSGDIFGLPDSEITKPSILFTPKPEAVMISEEEVVK
jgi:anaerobic dimethyl sulfoxide reductase subunit B